MKTAGISTDLLQPKRVRKGKRRLVSFDDLPEKEAMDKSAFGGPWAKGIGDFIGKWGKKLRLGAREFTPAESWKPKPGASGHLVDLEPQLKDWGGFRQRAAPGGVTGIKPGGTSKVLLGTGGVGLAATEMGSGEPSTAQAGQPAPGATAGGPKQAPAGGPKQAPAAGGQKKQAPAAGAPKDQAGAAPAAPDTGWGKDPIDFIGSKLKQFGQGPQAALEQWWNNPIFRYGSVGGGSLLGAYLLSQMFDDDDEEESPQEKIRNRYENLYKEGSGPGAPQSAAVIEPAKGETQKSIIMRKRDDATLRQETADGMSTLSKPASYEENTMQKAAGPKTDAVLNFLKLLSPISRGGGPGLGSVRNWGVSGKGIGRLALGGAAAQGVRSTAQGVSNKFFPKEPTAGGKLDEMLGGAGAAVSGAGAKALEALKSPYGLAGLGAAGAGAGYMLGKKKKHKPEDDEEGKEAQAADCASVADCLLKLEKQAAEGCDKPKDKDLDAATEARVLNPAAVSKDREDYTPGRKLSACLEKAGSAEKSAGLGQSIGRLVGMASRHPRSFGAAAGLGVGLGALQGTKPVQPAGVAPSTPRLASNPGVDLMGAFVRGNPLTAALRALKPSRPSSETPSGQPMSAENAARAAKIKELQQANSLMGQQRNPATAMATGYPEQARK